MLDIFINDDYCGAFHTQTNESWKTVPNTYTYYYGYEVTEPLRDLAGRVIDEEDTEWCFVVKKKW